jgi:hypothetical protein
MILLFLLTPAISAQGQQEVLQHSPLEKGKDPITISLMRSGSSILPSYAECISQLENQKGTIYPYQLHLEYGDVQASKIEVFGASLSEVNVLLQFAGFGYHMIGAENINGWTEGSFENVFTAFTTTPQWDSDGVFMNYIGHPYMGSTFYLIARNRGLGILGSWLVSTCGSLLWEYYYEAFYEIPSATDLLITSNVGLLIGELSWQAKKLLMESNQIERSLWKEVLIVVVDPWNTVSDWLNVGQLWAIDRAQINPYNSQIPLPYITQNWED